MAKDNPFIELLGTKSIKVNTEQEMKIKTDYFNRVMSMDDREKRVRLMNSHNKNLLLLFQEKKISSLRDLCHVLNIVVRRGNSSIFSQDNFRDILEFFDYDDVVWIVIPYIKQMIIDDSHLTNNISILNVMFGILEGIGKLAKKEHQVISVLTTYRLIDDRLDQSGLLQESIDRIINHFIENDIEIVSHIVNPIKCVTIFPDISDEMLFLRSICNRNYYENYINSMLDNAINEKTNVYIDQQNFDHYKNFLNELDQHSLKKFITLVISKQDTYSSKNNKNFIVEMLDSMNDKEKTERVNKIFKIMNL